MPKKSLGAILGQKCSKTQLHDVPGATSGEGGARLENPAPAPGTPNRPPGHRRAGSFLAAFCRDASCHSYILAL